MNVKFPIPCITEKFVDDIVFKCGGRRPTQKETNNEAIKNADYLFDNAIAELKIIEEEGLEKEERQSNIANIFKEIYPQADFVNIVQALEDTTVKRKYLGIIEKPIRKAIRKASKQLKSTSSFLGWENPEKIIIVVNNGFSSIQPEDFENICLKSSRNDTKQIDSIVTVTLRVVGNGFDTMTFINTKAIKVNGTNQSVLSEELRAGAVTKYAEAMTFMMQNQLEASHSPDKAKYIEDILFEKHGITFVLPAPYLPNSMFER